MSSRQRQSRAGRSRSRHASGGSGVEKDDLRKACAEEFRIFAQQAASLLESGRQGASWPGQQVAKVRQQVEALLEAEEKKGKQLAILRSKTDDLHRRLNMLAPSSTSAPSFTRPSQSQRPWAGPSAGSAVAPWAARRTARPRLLG
mmetsp:Transcript_11386/g.20153  ORF Transcript_11386/g.20153 Transcript_11386/m.20153 type:complete len:145 (-) Transcript_11386:92-526(-)